MSNEPILELAIQKCGIKFFVIMSREEETHEFGPFETEAQAHDMFEHLASEAFDRGWEEDANIKQPSGPISQNPTFSHTIN